MRGPLSVLVRCRDICEEKALPQQVPWYFLSQVGRNIFERLLEGVEQSCCAWPSKVKGSRLPIGMRGHRGSVIFQERDLLPAHNHKIHNHGRRTAAISNASH